MLLVIEPGVWMLTDCCLDWILPLQRLGRLPLPLQTQLKVGT